MVEACKMIAIVYFSVSYCVLPCAMRYILSLSFIYRPTVGAAIPSFFLKSLYVDIEDDYFIEFRDEKVAAYMS